MRLFLRCLYLQKKEKLGVFKNLNKKKESTDWTDWQKPTKIYNFGRFFSNTNLYGFFGGGGWV